MNSEYELFDFQYTLNQLTTYAEDAITQKSQKRKKKRGNEEFDDVDYDALLKMINEIPEDADVKDMPFYKEYLAKFDIEKYLGFLNLKKPNVVHVAEADYDLLLRLFFASFSIQYDFVINDDRTWSLVFLVKTRSDTLTNKLEEQGRVTISRIMNIFIGEMFKLCILKKEDENEAKSIEHRQKLNLLIFEKKAKTLKYQFENKFKKEIEFLDGLDIIAEIDKFMQE